MKKTTEKIFEQFLTRYPFMNPIREEIVFATNQIIACYQNNGKLLVCGNGGSNADADHIGGAFGAGERVGLGVAVRIDGAQIGQGRLAAGGGGVQQVVQLDQLLENHGKRGRL